MSLQAGTVVLVVAGVLALVAGLVARRTAAVGRRREREAVPVRGVVRGVQYNVDGPWVRLRLAWSAPDGSGERVGAWHGSVPPGTAYQVGQQVPLRVGRHDDWVQVTTAPRQSVVDGCGGTVLVVLGVLLVALGLVLRQQLG